MTEDVLEAPAATMPNSGEPAESPEPTAATAEQAEAPPPAVRGDRAPASETERAVACIWAGVLRLERIGADADFFDLGGDSLKAQRVLSQIETEFGVRIPMRIAYANATVTQLSAHIDRARQIGMTEEEELASIIDSLSDEEVHALLGDALHLAETNS